MGIDEGEVSISTALVPVQQRQVDFYGDEIVAVVVDEGEQPQVYVPLRPIVEYLGMSWSGQFERVKGDEVLADVVRSVRVTRTEADTRTLLCLPLEYLSGWLFGIEARRVKPELKDKIIRYRRECYRVLAQAFQAEALATAESMAAPMDTSAPMSLAQIREMGLAIARMAEQQMALDTRVQSIDVRLDRAAIVVRDLDRRIRDVERHTGIGATVTEPQAAEIAMAVKAIGQRLVATGQRDGYAKVYSELYRRYRVSGYKSLPAASYEGCLAWLHGWYKELTTDVKISPDTVNTEP
ncbi:MAG: phage antirepressor N-terminal domain-containing protein [Chloroflexota bacterium]